MGRSQRKRAVIEKKDEAQPVGAAKSLERYAFPSNHDIYTRESSMLAAFEVCAAWEQYTLGLFGALLPVTPLDVRKFHEFQGKNGIPLLAGRLRGDVEIMMNDDSWLKFVVVRDPADRLLSGFLNKCLGAEWQNCPYIEFMPERFPNVTQRNDMTDAIFLAAIRDEPRIVFRDYALGVRRDVRRAGCKVNSHWRPQYCFCSIARFLPSYHVIPFSNMSMESVALVDHMTRPSPERARLLREFFANRFSKNYDAKQQGATTKRDKYFSMEALMIIKQVYAKDYRLFAEYFDEHEALPL